MARRDGVRDDDAADRLNRDWDALVQAAAVHPGGHHLGVDGESDLADAVRLLHRRDDAPPPDPGFSIRLWQALIAPGAIPREAERSPTPVPSGRAPRPLGIVHPFARRRVLVELAAAAAIALALLGGALDGRGPFPSLLGVTPTAAAREVEATAGPSGICAASPTPGPAMNGASDGAAAPQARAAVSVVPPEDGCGPSGG